MRHSILIACVCLILFSFNCSCAQETRDGVFIHITHGNDSPHHVLMALQMAEITAADHDVLIYFDIKGVEAVLKDSPNFEYKHFTPSREQIKKLIKAGVTIMACPGCLKAAGKSAGDLIDGIQVANKETFFSFTSGRILTLDY